MLYCERIEHPVALTHSQSVRVTDSAASHLRFALCAACPGTKQIYSAVHVRTYGNLAGEEGSTNDRLPVNATAYQPLLALIECVRNRTGIYPIFLAISDVNARRVRAGSRQRAPGDGCPLPPTLAA